MKENLWKRVSATLAIVLIGGALDLSIAAAAPDDTPIPASTSALAPKDAPLRVLPLGDSITWGLGSGPATSYSGYRGPLQELLKTDSHSYAYDFVGPLRGGYAPVDPDNAGYSGWRIEQINAYATQWVTTAKPDVVLLHVGTNDMNQNYQTATAPQRLKTLIDTVRAAAPGVKIIVSMIVPSPNATIQARITEYNQGVASVTNAEAAEHGDVSLVDMSTALTPTYAADFADYLHPNDKGYAKMATVWNTGITELL